MDFRRLRPWILTASLLANGFLAGMLVVDRPPPPGPPKPGDIVEKMAAGLPAADARILRQAAGDQGLHDIDRDQSEQHQRIGALMRAEPFDAEAFRQAVTELANRREQAGDRVGKTLIQAIPQMSAAGRQALSRLGPPPPKQPD